MAVSNTGNLNIYKQFAVNPDLSVKKSALSQAQNKDSFKTEPNGYANYTGYVTSPISDVISPRLLLKSFCRPETLLNLVNNTPKVKQMLSEKGQEVSINPSNVTKIANQHLTATTSYALQIANKLNLSAYDKKILEQACMFHDLGKALMPENIVNKPGRLNEKERDLMSLHAEIGADLLETAGFNPRITDLVRNHHKPLNENSDLLGQILSVADIFSALREARSYKLPLSVREAELILDQKAQNGEVSAEVVNALKDINCEYRYTA